MTRTDEREHQRIKSLNLLAYTCIDEDKNVVKQGMARTLNVSESGILMETDSQLDSQHIVSLTIGLEDELVDIDGKLVRSEKNEAGKFECGIEFQEKDKKTLQILKEYLQAFRQQKDEPVLKG